MKSIGCWNDLASYGIDALTGEACGLSYRILCDVIAHRPWPLPSGYRSLMPRSPNRMQNHLPGGTSSRIDSAPLPAVGKPQAFRVTMSEASADLRNDWDGASATNRSSAAFLAEACQSSAREPPSCRTTSSRCPGGDGRFHWS